MPDIVPNLLHLSSEVADVDDLLEPALDLVLTATGAEAAAIARGHAAALDGRSRSRHRPPAVPLDLAADALERDASSPPSAGSPRRSSRRVAIVTCRPKPSSYCSSAATCPEPRFAVTANRLARCARHRRATRARRRRRVERLETILEITHDWQQTNEMETLLVRMAEAATRLLRRRPRQHLPLGQAEQNDRRPAGAGRRGRRAAACRTMRASSARWFKPASRAASAATHDDDEIDRAVDRKTGYQTETILCVPLVSPDGDTARRVRGAQQARRPVHRRGPARPDRAGVVRRRRAGKHAAVRRAVSTHEKLVEQAAQDTLARRRKPGDPGASARRSDASPTPISPS